MGNGRWLWLWMLAGTWLAAGELEVRCYRVGWFHLERALWVPEEIDDPFSADDEDLVEDGPVWQEIEEAGFESRFLEGHGELRDYRPLLVKWFGGEFDGQAVYDLKQKHLVVRAAAAEQEELAKDLRNGIPMQVKVQVSLFEMPYESARDLGIFWEEVPADALELASLATLSVPGEISEAKTLGGGTVV